MNPIRSRSTAFIFAWSGAVMKLRRFYPLAVISACAGLLAAALEMDYFRGIATLAAIVGGLLLMQGWRVRKAYLQNNPLPDSWTTNRELSTTRLLYRNQGNRR